jgi:peptide-methionine (R)-S-oxide reductase
VQSAEEDSRPAPEVIMSPRSLSILLTALLGLLLTACHPQTGRGSNPGDPTVSPRPSQEELKARLSPEQYRVTQERGTEAPYTGQYWNHHEDGRYTCVVCGALLFTSESKFDSGCGWPSFFSADNEHVSTRPDTSHGMERTEILCATCGAHLGHVFDDGPQPTGLRYCVNSASLDFEKK